VDQLPHASPGRPDGSPPSFPPPPEEQPPNLPGFPPIAPQQPYGQRGFYPLDFGRIWSLSLSLYRFRWRTFVGLSLAVAVPLSALVAAADAIQLSSPDWYSQVYATAQGEALDAFVSSFWSSLPLSVAYGLVAGILGLIGSAALIDTTTGTFAGRPADGVGSVRRALSRVLTFGAMYAVIFVTQLLLIAVGILASSALFQSTAVNGRPTPGPAVFGGLIVFVATGVVIAFFAVRWSLAAQVVMTESVGALTALRRSWHLVAGSAWRVLGYVVGLGLLVGFAAGLIGAFVMLLINPFRIVGFTQVSIDPVRLGIATFVTGIIAGLFTPITTIATTLLYLDLRFRHGERIKPPGQGSISEESVSEQ
jgi:hypothetical protein